MCQCKSQDILKIVILTLTQVRDRVQAQRFGISTVSDLGQRRDRAQRVEEDMTPHMSDFTSPLGKRNWKSVPETH